ncbi:MAG TPA: hypothetical protein VHK67_05105, partial [Rhabdochlamydiaceae bacterium]|nr:hypothetical protein [Rhabdochlamydiaceae bacterium]
TAEFGDVHLQMSERKYRQNDPESVLVHLAVAKSLHHQLSSYHRYLKFISSVRRLSAERASIFNSMNGWKKTCVETCHWFLQKPPAFPKEDQWFRSDYANALVSLGKWYTDNSESAKARIRSIFGSTGQQKSNLKAALNCYTQALVFSEGEQEQVVIQKLWNLIDKMLELKVNLRRFQSTMFELALKNEKCVEAAQQSLVCLKYFSSLAVDLAEWEKIATRFAVSMARVCKNNAFAQHFVLVDLSLQLMKTYGETTHRRFIKILRDHLSLDELRSMTKESV